MAEVIKRSRWSFKNYEQSYRVELPEECRNPLGAALAFYRQQNAHEIFANGRTLRLFREGSYIKAVLGVERHVSQEIEVSVDIPGQSLICEYRLTAPYPKFLPNFHFPPWPLQREAAELEKWIKQNPNGHPNVFISAAPLRAAVGKNGHGRSAGLHYRLPYYIYRVFSWMRYWVPRRFTKAGLVALGALAVATVLGADPESSVGYQGFTLLVGLLMLSVLFGFRFKAKFLAERMLPRFGTVGQPFTYRVAVKNLTKEDQNGLSLLENLKDVRPGFHEWTALQVDDNKHVRAFRFGQRRRQNPFRLAKAKESAVPLIRPNQSGEVSLEMTPLRRGLVQLDGVTLARPDPLGLFRALRKVAVPQSVLVLPKRYYVPPIALPGAMKYQQGGVALASNVGQSDEFVALREYRRGDPVRHIHWRSWAKAGKPIVKEFEDEFFVRHALILDTFTDRPYTDEFEEAVSVAASFACTVLTQESLLDLLFVESQAYCFTAGRGLAHADQMLEVLASVQPCARLSFDTLDELVINHANLVSGCICVLLAWDEARQKLVEKLKAFGLPVLVLVIQSHGKAKALEFGPMQDEPERLVALEVGRVEEQLAALK